MVYTRLFGREDNGQSRDYKILIDHAPKNFVDIYWLRMPTFGCGDKFFFTILTFFRKITGIIYNLLSFFYDSKCLRLIQFLKNLFITLSFFIYNLKKDYHYIS